MRMGRATESVRFLDDVDFTFSLDSRSSSSHQMTNIEIVTKPIVFRASYRDINLITSIINRAIERYGRSQESLSKQKVDDVQNADHQDMIPALSSTYDRSRSQSVGKARVLMSKEQVSNAYVDTKISLTPNLYS